MSRLTDRVIDPTRVTQMHNVEELELLEEYARKSRGPIANLGCHRGVSAAVLALASTHRVYSVDTYDWDSAAPGAPTPTNKEIAYSLWASLGLERQISQCVGTTDEWAVRLSDVRFGFVFIDADHGQLACMADFVNWSPLIVPGGWVAFHDTDNKRVAKVLAKVEAFLPVVAERNRIKVLQIPDNGSI